MALLSGWIKQKPAVDAILQKFITPVKALPYPVTELLHSQMRELNSWREKQMNNATNLLPWPDWNKKYAYA